jgi:TATA-binding protein-associated factor Taf7
LLGGWAALAGGAGRSGEATPERGDAEEEGCETEGEEAAEAPVSCTREAEPMKEDDDDDDDDEEEEEEDEEEAATGECRLLAVALASMSTSLRGALTSTLMSIVGSSSSPSWPP